MILAYGRKLPDGKPGPIAVADATRTIHIIGMPGSGKTSLLRFLIEQSECGAVLDVEEVLAPHQKHITFSPEHEIQPFNLLATSRPYATVDDLLFCFQRAWPDGWGHRMADLLRHSLLLAMEFGLKLTDVPRILSHQPTRDRLAHGSENEAVRQFFLEHLAGVSARDWRVWIEAARNKLSAFVLNPYLRPFFETNECLDFRQLMDDGELVHFNLPERILKDSANLMGMLIVSRIYAASLERAEGSRPWPVFIDEFQRVANPSVIDLSVRGRKRGVNLVISHQSIFQHPFDRDHGLIEGVLASSGVKVVFSCGRRDAERMARELLPPSGMTPKRVKKKDPWWGGQDVQSFYSTSEEEAQIASALERQNQGECMIRVGHDVYEAVTYQAPPPEPPDEPNLAPDRPFPPRPVPQPASGRNIKRRAI